ncbi:hypothetical protein FRC01_001226 [Tulasnella sp. 417]|nr:hypothetical protein FRC01_001226 [Tulasnella sp. 417]
MIFCNTAKMTALLAEMLLDLRASLPQSRTMLYKLHGGVTQNKLRLRSDDFRNDKSGAAVLVTSDVSARGVDYPNVTEAYLTTYLGHTWTSQIYVSYVAGHPRMHITGNAHAYFG